MAFLRHLNLCRTYVGIWLLAHASGKCIRNAVKIKKNTLEEEIRHLSRECFFKITHQHLQLLLHLKEYLRRLLHLHRMQDPLCNSC